MTKFKETKFIKRFKELANSKSVTAEDMLAHAIFKATRVEPELAKDLVYVLAKQAFSPLKFARYRNHPRQSLINARNKLIHTLTWKDKLLGKDIDEVLGEEREVFTQLATDLRV